MAAASSSQWPYRSSSSSTSSTSSNPSSSSSGTSLILPSTPRPSTHRQSLAPPRKIRFAPLPDPRRAVLVDENGEEIPIPYADDATTISCPVSPAVAPTDLPPQDTSSLSSFGSSKRNSDTDPSTTPGTATPASTPSEYDNSRPGSPSSSPINPPPPLPKVQSISVTQLPKPKGLSILHPFKRSSASSSSSSSASLTPTPSIDRATNGNSGRKGISTEEILTLGTINLFRPSSRESNKSSDSTHGWNLSRWASSGNGKESLKQWGAPLARSQSSQSTQSYRSKTPSLLSGLRLSSASGRSKQSGPVKKGTRMLNGRVYGGRRLNPNANLFANAPDSEPEFVEWGYGGMGSVKGAKSAGANSKWDRLHGNAQDEDLDDGGGMSWVKKRKEAREKKEREEREQTEQAEREAAIEVIKEEDPSGDSQDPSTAPATPRIPPIPESAMLTPRCITPDIPNPAKTMAKASSASLSTHHSASTVAPSSPSPSHHVPAQDDHVFTTMAIPMPRPHHRPRSNTRDGMPSPPYVGDNEKNSYFEVQSVDKNRDSGSESESETESDSDRDEDDDEDEDDEEDETRRGAMVIGAGMEKISRHRVEHEEHP